MGTSFAYILFMILSLGGGGDLCDLLPTDAYWHAKGGTPAVEALRASIADNTVAVDVSADIAKLASDDFQTRKTAKEALAAKGASITDQLKKGVESKDPETAATCRELLTSITATSQEKNIRRLMAIRTLGEMKDKDAVPALKKLTDSKEPFVADYAHRALDTISGTPHPRAAAKIDGDIQLLPKTTGTVGQLKSSGEVMTLDKMMDSIPQMVQPQPDQKPEDARREAMDKMSQQILTLAETTGNFRLDGATIGVSKEVGPNAGWVAIIVRGQFDRDAIVAAMKTAGGGSQIETVDGVTTISNGRSMQFMLPSNTTAVMVTGPTMDSTADARAALLTAIKTGKGEFAQNTDMPALLKQADQTKDIWAVMQVPPMIAQEIPFLSGIDTLVLGATHKGQAVIYDIKGAGADADKVKECATSLQTMIDAQIKQMDQQIAQFKQMGGNMAALTETMESAKTMLSSIKIASDGKNATLTGEMNVIKTLGSFFGAMHMSRTQNATPQPVQIAPR